jgi:hypothetical protein
MTLGRKLLSHKLYPERKKKQENFWKYIEDFFRRYEQEWNPVSRWKIFVFREGWYLLIRFILLCLVFVAVSNEINVYNIIFVVIGLLFLFDILAFNTSNSFITMTPINSLRSFFLTFFAFTHLIIAYGIFYKFFKEQFAIDMCNTQLLYFSAVTITTLGDGTFLPDQSGTMVQMLVILELLTGLFFISGVIARIINFTSAGRASKRIKGRQKRRINI